MDDANMIDISKLDKAEALAALHAASRQQGMGFLQSPRPITVEQARELLEQTTYFDYLSGRVMKISLAGDELDPWAYDRDNGHGAALRALQPLIDAAQPLP